MIKKINNIYSQLEDWSIRDLERLESEIDSLIDSKIEEISNGTDS